MSLLSEQIADSVSCPVSAALVHGLAVEELRDGLGHRDRPLEVEEMPDAGDRAFLDVGHPGAQELGDFHPERRCVAAKDRERRLADSGGFRVAELPLGESRQLDLEEGLGVLDSLGHHARDAGLEQRPAIVPPHATHGGEEHGERLLVLAGGVRVEHRGCLLQEGLTGRNR